MTMGAVAKAPPFPGSKSAGLPFILDDKRTKAQAAEQSALDDIRKQWYDLVFKRQFDLAATACFARPPPSTPLALLDPLYVNEIRTRYMQLGATHCT